MIFVIIKFVLPAILICYLFHKILDKNQRYSKAALVLILTSLVFNTALAQNYNYSLIPYPERDGFSVSNPLAYYVFGEDHFGHWSSELFKTGYQVSIYVTLLFLFVYIICLIIERNK
jgi:hypothetical protein